MRCRAGRFEQKPGGKRRGPRRAVRWNSIGRLAKLFRPRHKRPGGLKDKTSGSFRDVA